MGLDIGSSAVKAVELALHGHDLVVTGFGQIDVASDSPEARRQAVIDLFGDGGFRSRRVVTSVSGKLVVIRYLTMARMSDDELRNAIQLEAEKYVPFSLDECVLDCQRLDGPPAAAGATAGAAGMNVLLVAAKRSQIDDHIGLLGEAGLIPEIIDVDPFALGNAWTVSTSVERRMAEAEKAIAFVDIGCRKTTLNIVRGDASLFTREIYFGGADFTSAIARQLSCEMEEAEGLKRQPADDDQIREAVFPALDELGSEIQLSFDYFANTFEKEVDALYLTGGGSRLGFICEAFEKIFEKPVTPFNPFEGLRVGDGVDGALLAANAPQLVIAVGLASRLRKD